MHTVPGIRAGTLPFAKGGVFDRGGVVGSSTMFPIGMMGEAGPEAILPLRRGRGGALGVQAQGGGNSLFAPVVNINYNRNAMGRDDVEQGAKVAKMVQIAIEEQFNRMVRRQKQTGGYLTDPDVI